MNEGAILACARHGYDRPSSAGECKIRPYKNQMVTKDDVKKIAELARLEIPENELEKFTGQMNQILEFMGRLNALETSGIEPTSHALPIVNAFREDVVRESDIIKKALDGAPESEGGLFKVPKVI